MALWSRVKSWVNEHIRETPALEPQAPMEPILPQESYTYEDVYDIGSETGLPAGMSYQDPSSDHIVIIDDSGIYRGSMNYEDWWQATLVSSEQFHQRFGDDFYTVELIFLLEENLGIAWDWDTWREDYEMAYA